MFSLPLISSALSVHQGSDVGLLLGLINRAMNTTWTSLYMIMSDLLVVINK